MYGQVAQLVEQRTENPRVGGSIPPLATILFIYLRRLLLHRFANYRTKCPFGAQITHVLELVADRYASADPT